MSKKSQPIPKRQQSQLSLNQSCQDENQTLHHEQDNLKQQLQIEHDYDDPLHNQIFNDKKSNFNFRITPDHQVPISCSKKYLKKNKKKKIHSINAKDITDIIIIILLVLILGVSLFRVVLEVEIQYKNSQQLSQLNKKYPNSISELSPRSQNSLTNGQILNSTPKQPQIVINISPQCQRHIQKILSQHGDLYDFKLPDQELKIKSNLNRYQEGKNNLIDREKYSEAVTLIRLTHTVNSDGSLSISSDPCENETVKKLRLINTVSSQFDRWNSKYQIDSYHSKQLPFCLVVNSYNNAKSGLIYRNLDSILQQNYTNYHIVYTDDKSTDQTGAKVLEYLKQKNFSQSKYDVTINPTKNGMMENIYTAIHKRCKQGEIVAMVDGDDSLIGVNVLSLLNAVYQKQRVALLWANFLSVFHNNQVSIGFSHDYTEKQKLEGNFRKMKGFISSHLKTFFVDLFRKIKVQDLQLNNGKFFGGASDTAMMMPMIEMANPRFQYLPEILYEYRYDTGQTGNLVNKVPQKQALGKIFGGKEYQKLGNFSFIDRAIQNGMVVLQIQKSLQQSAVYSGQIDQLPQDLDDSNIKK